MNHCPIAYLRQGDILTSSMLLYSWQDKKKGKKGKKQDFDEDDLLDELAEIEAEMGGGKKPKNNAAEEENGEGESAKKVRCKQYTLRFFCFGCIRLYSSAPQSKNAVSTF